jgi:hypothetical protein
MAQIRKIGPSSAPPNVRTSVTCIALGLLAALAALMWPALYNGQPFFYPDTTAYIRGADAGLQKITGLSSRWSLSDDDGPTVHAQTSPDDSPFKPSISSIKDKSVLSGRSVYYGALLYFGDLIGRFWSTVLAQAILLILAMALFLRAFGVSTWPELAIVSVLIGLLTSASFYVSFLMPDLFAAVTVLACASLTGGRSLRRVDYYLWFALLGLSLVSHTSHVLIAATLLGLALLIDVARRSRENWRGLAVIAGCLALAAAAETAFGIAVTHLVGAPPLRPPFVMARAIEDGPGYQYLRDTCPASGFKVCEFLPRLPMSADRFLWDWNPPGVFASASPQIRRQLSAEQYQFVWAVLKYDPLSFAKVLTQDVLRQFFMMGLSEFDWSNSSHLNFAAKLPVEYRASFRASAAYRGVMPTRATSVIQLLVFGLGAATLLALFVWPRLREQFDRQQLNLVALVLIGVAANAVICGTISGPHDRYEARVAWLIPFVALAAVLALMQRRRMTRQGNDIALSSGKGMGVQAV